VYQVREVFPPFVMGGIIAYLLFPLVSMVHRLNRFRLLSWMGPKWAVGIIYISTAVILGFFACRFGPTLAEQVSNLIEQRHEIVTKLVYQIANGFNIQLDVEKTSTDLLSTIENSIGKPEEVVHLGGLLSHGLLSLLVCIVSSIYFIVDSKRIGRFFLRFVPEERKVTTVNMIGQMNLMLSKYVLGQILLIIIMSCVAFAFLSLLPIALYGPGVKMKYALLIAILSGFFEIIPVLGPFIAISIAVIVGVSQFGIGIAGWIIACYVLARWFEDYAVVPAVIGRAVELHALAVIFAVLVGETMAGALGMLIAIPVAASIKVIVDSYYPPEKDLIEPHAEEPHLFARMMQFLDPVDEKNRGEACAETNILEKCEEPVVSLKTSRLNDKDPTSETVPLSPSTHEGNKVERSQEKEV
jgi:predicted PurR-regulated permease PerM